jgi:large subunit ribosomal protein L32
MGVPKRKLSRSRRDSRSANKGIRPQMVTGCLTCQAPVMPHQVCQECGYYKGVKVLRTKVDRLHARGKARQEMVQAYQERQAASSKETAAE